MDASNFTDSRSNDTALTDKRIKLILKYIADCYLKVKSDGVVYDYRLGGKIKPENYLRNKFVDDYLRKYTSSINSGTTEITFITKESTEPYISSEDSDEHDDPIDIYILDTGLEKAWKGGNHVYFAIECKRIVILSDTSKYVNDIWKFTTRNYTSTRLPFEGQIAFIENSKLKDSVVIKEINKKLENHNTVETVNYLNEIKINDSFNSSYISIHKKNSSENLFSIYHLLFDYSDIIVN